MLGPVCWMLGLFLRWLAPYTVHFPEAQQRWLDAQPFAAPTQLAVYAQNPTLVTAAYALFLLGAVLLVPAVIAFARMIATSCPRLAFWGSLVFIASLFARIYWSGVDYTAFQLVDVLGLDRATDAVVDGYVGISYGPWWLPVTAVFGQYLGPLLLAVGAFRSGVFGLLRSLLLVWSAMMWAGVLKESGALSVIHAAALCLLLVPLGIRVLRNRVPQLTTRPTAVPPAERVRLRLLSW